MQRIKLKIAAILRGWATKLETFKMPASEVRVRLHRIDVHYEFKTSESALQSEQLYFAHRTEIAVQILKQLEDQDLVKRISWEADGKIGLGVRMRVIKPLRND